MQRGGLKYKCVYTGMQQVEWWNTSLYNGRFFKSEWKLNEKVKKTIG